MLSNNILSIVKFFNEKKTEIGKTILQKVVYFSFDEENRGKFYIPYVYGPYSEAIQLMVDSLISENYLSYNNKKLLTTKHSIDSFQDPFPKRFSTTVTFLFKNKIKTAGEISNLAKLNIIVSNNNGDSHNPSFIKERAKMLGWSELSSLSTKEISTLLEINDRLEADLSSTGENVSSKQLSN